MGELICYTTTITINEADPITSLGELGGEVLSVFPNPFSNNINVVSGQQISSFVLVDQLGKVLYQVNEPALDGLSPYTLNIEFLNSGIYFLFVNTHNGVSVRTIKKT